MERHLKPECSDLGCLLWSVREYILKKPMFRCFGHKKRIAIFVKIAILIWSECPRSNQLCPVCGARNFPLGRCPRKIPTAAQTRAPFLCHRQRSRTFPLVPSWYGHERSPGLMNHYGKRRGSAKSRPSSFGRSDWTRTSGLLVPNQAHYQTVPHPEMFLLKN